MAHSSPAQAVEVGVGGEVFKVVEDEDVVELGFLHQLGHAVWKGAEVDHPHFIVIGGEEGGKAIGEGVLDEEDTGRIIRFPAFQDGDAVVAPEERSIFVPCFQRRQVKVGAFFLSVHRYGGQGEFVPGQGIRWDGHLFAFVKVGSVKALHVVAGQCGKLHGAQSLLLAERPVGEVSAVGGPMVVGTVVEGLRLLLLKQGKEIQIFGSIGKLLPDCFDFCGLIHLLQADGEVLRVDCVGAGNDGEGGTWVPFQKGFQVGEIFFELLF